MLRLLLFSLLFILSLEAKELVIIGDKSFKDKNITLQEVKDFFLAKKRFLEGKKILVMNYEHDNLLRECFETMVLKKSSRSIERYWQKAYYQGKRPPKIVTSKEMLLTYMQVVQPSIGYVDKGKELPAYTLILFEIKCQ
ncbi:MAG TPA: hypothetical protein ENK95_03990 [Campylobacterales bacterium]|nr:hypothetical protein [Campylobacterales bacterium]